MVCPWLRRNRASPPFSQGLYPIRSSRKGLISRNIDANLRSIVAHAKPQLFCKVRSWARRLGGILKMFGRKSPERPLPPSATPFRVADVFPGNIDDAGRKIIEVYDKRQDFAIYLAVTGPRTAGATGGELSLCDDQSGIRDRSVPGITKERQPWSTMPQLTELKAARRRNRLEIDK